MPDHQCFSRLTVLLILKTDIHDITYFQVKLGKTGLLYKNKTRTYEGLLKQCLNNFGFWSTLFNNLHDQSDVSGKKKLFRVLIRDPEDNKNYFFATT